MNDPRLHRIFEQIESKIALPTLYPVLLPLSAADRLLRGRDRTRAQSRRAREALALSCASSGVPIGPFRKDRHDAPLPFAGTYWSVSHKPCYVAAVVSPTRVGIDLEEIIPRNPALWSYIADADEWALLRHQRDHEGDQNWEMFFRFWTAKEAVLKAAGVGLAHLQKARISAVLSEDGLLVDYAAALWPVRHYRFQRHIVSLTHTEKVVWKLIDSLKTEAEYRKGYGTAILISPSSTRTS